ncbi:putative uncharacterized protein [Clostridium sp. CAG:356]|nr:putative uncharacterized protein [Clostridium sp. CAG:356]
MKVLVNLLKFIFIMILTVAIIGLGLFAIAFSTVLNKDYVVQKLEETDFYSGTYKLVESNFENYIYQSGLDEEVLKEICSQDKVKKDINIMLNNIYSGTNQSIDTTEISEKLNANIDKSGIKNKQNESAINEFVKHICQEYTDTLVHSKYETEINRMYNKINTMLNKVYNVLLIVLVVDLILIIIINRKKISKDIQALGIALMSASIFQIVACQIITTNVDVKNIKIFNDVFSNSLVTIIQDVLNKINSLALGTCIFAIIILGIYVSIKVNKKTKDEPEQSEAE